MDLLKTVEIFGFSGKLGTGKDFLANALNNMLPAVPTLFLALADQLKIEAIVKGGLSRDKVYGKKDEETRKVLQELGTSQGRDKYGEDIWINYLTEWMIQHVNRGIRRFFITDVRFSNEVYLRFGSIGRIWVTQKLEEAFCPNYVHVTAGSAPAKTTPLRGI